MNLPAVRRDAMLDVALVVWPFPEPPMDMGVEDGIVWAITRGPCVGVNGYVLIPAEGHPWSAGIPSRGSPEYAWTEYAYEYLLSVHGGITYGTGACDGSSPIWLGFDTAHSGDGWSPEFDPHGLSDRYRDVSWGKDWTVELVIEEVKSLARQLASLPQIERGQ